jgi:hypothetical protein
MAWRVTCSAWPPHAGPCTTRLYDRRQKKIARKIVERISI